MQLYYFRVDSLVFNSMSLLNGPIENVITSELLHHAATKGYVDDRFVAYTPTEQLDFRFKYIYSKKYDLQTTDLNILTLLHNISQSSILDPFAFTYSNVTFLYRLSFPFDEKNAYHFEPMESWSFELPLT